MRTFVHTVFARLARPVFLVLHQVCCAMSHVLGLWSLPASKDVCRLLADGGWRRLLPSGKAPFWSLDMPSGLGEKGSKEAHKIREMSSTMRLQVSVLCCGFCSLWQPGGCFGRTTDVGSKAHSFLQLSKA